MSESKYEMIICIVNSGFADQVMDASREAGATGGTIIRGRGTANSEAEEMFHIKIQPEKEIVMIIVPESIKDNVLHKIYKDAVLNSFHYIVANLRPIELTEGVDN